MHDTQPHAATQPDPSLPICTLHTFHTGLTKLVSQLSREGHWAKALEVYESLDAVGIRPDTTITNAAISACDKGGQWEKALHVFRCAVSGRVCARVVRACCVLHALSCMHARHAHVCGAARCTA